MKRQNKEDQFKLRLLEEDTIKDLYQRRLNGYLRQVDYKPEIETKWEQI